MDEPTKMGGILIMYETGYWDNEEKCIKPFVEISMCGCSKRNRLTGKELEERHRIVSSKK